MSQPIIMPKLGMDMVEGTLLNWMKQPGDTIKPGDVIAEVETDKTAVEVVSDVGGVILQLVGNLGDPLKVGSTIGYVGAAREAVAAPTAPAAAPAAAPAKAAPAAATPATASSNGDGYPGGVKASPIARAVATERGIDLRMVKGTGPAGRITKDDVLAFTPPPQAATGFKANYGKLPEGNDVEIIDTTKMRRIIADRMVESKQQVPNFDVTTEIDVEALLNLRKQLNDGLSDDYKISVNDLIVKAVALTLRKYPNLNSHYYGDKIARHKRINIGIAVALSQGGLMNVVAQSADKASLSEMAFNNKAMIARARDGKVKIDDISGSTFTVSNLGVYEVEHFKAIINPPEAAILAVGVSKKVPVVKADGSIGVGQRMRLTLSVDHRVSDGAEGAQFMQALKQILENPMRLVV
jgi:pyruvate dehydrogenase E2 component (dihydrolipoamide acetyltransferase)